MNVNSFERRITIERAAPECEQQPMTNTRHPSSLPITRNRNILANANIQAKCQGNIPSNIIVIAGCDLNTSSVGVQPAAESIRATFVDFVLV